MSFELFDKDGHCCKVHWRVDYEELLKSGEWFASSPKDKKEKIKTDKKPKQKEVKS